MSEKPRYIKIIVTVRVTGDFKDKWYLNEMRASFVGSGACGTDYEYYVKKLELANKEPAT